jgi:ParB/Sulfiredoxin domain
MTTTTDKATYARLGDIVTPDPTWRNDHGELGALAASISFHGLLRPPQVISINDRLHLVHGLRRFRAMWDMGWDMIPVTIVASMSEAADAIAADDAEGSCLLSRKWSETYRFGSSLEALPDPLIDAAHHHRMDEVEALREERYAKLARTDQRRPAHKDSIVNIIIAPALGLRISTWNMLRRMGAKLTDDDPKIHQLAVELFDKLDNRHTSLYGAAAVLRHASGPRKTRKNVTSGPMATHRQLVADMLAKGMTPKQVADTLGMVSSGNVREMARRNNIPVPNDPRGKMGRDKRNAQLRKLAGQGYTAIQIADALGYKGPEHIKRVADSLGIEIRPHITGHTPSLFDQNQIMEQLVADLTHVEPVASLIDYTKLDADRLPEWAAALADVVRWINRIKKGIEERISQ